MTLHQADSTQQHIWIKDISENDAVKGCYLVKKKSSGTTRRGEPFLSLILSDRTGEVEAKIWDRAEELTPLFHEADIIEIIGNAGSYRDRIQLRISQIRVPDGEIDPGIFLESTTADISSMMNSLRQILLEVNNTYLRKLIDMFLGDRQFVSMLKKAPAAKNFHHCYLGGLLEHTLSVCRIARMVADHYPQLDKNLLITAAFLHDIGKIKEFKFDYQIEYTDEGRLIGHIVLSVAMLSDKLVEFRNFPEDLAIKLKHMILSHHGQYEFGSPKRPKILEAFALHMVDDLDAKMTGINRMLQRDNREGSWTDFNRLFERYLLKGEVFALQKKSDENQRKEEKQQRLFSI
ncbi:MAG: CRISPR-associated endonuclease Cas3'' [Deltaproteobacteria bacterium]|nr:CRISPR-associated endonuclease Cas3'' [Deltaproteobacteria bacterium]